MKEFQSKNYWALVLGGSSGLGLATAKKLAKHGMNICVVHRNSRFQEAEITLEFNKITERLSTNSESSFLLPLKNLESKNISPILELV